MSLILSLLFVLYINILHSSKDFDCIKTFTSPITKKTNATYNLCKLQLSTTTENIDGRTYYEVFDDRSSPFYNFTYIFNVCNDIESNPPDEICWNNTLREMQLMPIGPCTSDSFNDTNGECIDQTPITKPTAAYQIHRGMDTQEIVHDCYRMHDGKTEPVWSFLDASDPTIGVRLTYLNGDWCDAAEKNREFSLEFVCSEDTENIPDKREETITEDETCSYVMTVYTAYGCPSECPISLSNNKLCHGHGVCEFDFTNLKPRCYCYHGFCGDDCSKTDCNVNNDVLYNITAPNDEETCLFELNDAFGITSYYNLSYFNLNGENFEVEDDLDREYIYKFNICGNIQNFLDETDIPSTCNGYNHGPCTHLVEESYTYQNQTSTTKYCNNEYDTYDSGSVPKAVQLYYPKNNKSEPKCYWLGMNLPDGFNMPSFNVSLLDPEDAGRGVVFKIYNGEYCNDAEKNRELIINLRCPDSSGFAFDPYEEAKSIINETILESDTCVYEIEEFESPLACPVQCIYQRYDTYSVCAQHGICASDPEAGQVRCICDAGWMGPTCSIPVRNVSTTTTASGGGAKTTIMTTQSGAGNGGGGDGKKGNGVSIGLGIGITLLALIVIGVFVFLQRKKRQEVGMYGNLQESINDAGIET